MMSDVEHLFMCLGQGQQKQKTKAKNKQMGLNPTKKLCMVKKMINKTKRQPIEWEEVFAHDTSSKGLIPKITRTDTTQYHIKQSD